MARTKTSSQTTLRGIIDDAQSLIDKGVRNGELTKRRGEELRTKALSRLENALLNANHDILDEITRERNEAG